MSAGYRLYERIEKLRALLATRRPLTIDDLMRRLEASRATIKRDIAFLRDRLGLDIRSARGRGSEGYVLHTPKETQ